MTAIARVCGALPIIIIQALLVIGDIECAVDQGVVTLLWEETRLHMIFRPLTPCPGSARRVRSILKLSYSHLEWGAPVKEERTGMDIDTP